MIRVKAINKANRVLEDTIGTGDLDEVHMPLTEKQRNLILTALKPANLVCSKSKISALTGYSRYLQWDCLRFDADGDPYIFINHRISKTAVDLSIPIAHLGKIVVDAIRRQQKRVKDVPVIGGVHYLFLHRSKKNKWIFITNEFMNKGRKSET